MNDNKIFITEDAASYIHQFISGELAAKLHTEDIMKILEAEFEWQRRNGLILENTPIEIELPPIEIDEETMSQFIINFCADKNIVISKDELADILDGELDYMQSIGSIDNNNDSSLKWQN